MDRAFFLAIVIQMVLLYIIFVNSFLKLLTFLVPEMVVTELAQDHVP
jgi:hypothetical protein